MVVFAIIGAFIGAGFASGQEIYLFFYKYGIKGIFGLVLCSALIPYVIYKTLIQIAKLTTLIIEFPFGKFSGSLSLGRCLRA